MQEFLKYYLPEKPRQIVCNDLKGFGDKVIDEYAERSKLAEMYPPKLEKYDAWGREINKLYVSESWNFFRRQSAIEGLVAIPYEGLIGEYCRIWQAIKLMLFTPSGGLYGCPLAMTDGAAFVLRDKSKDSEILKGWYDQLTTRDPTKFITAGQWMTEKRGGSDVRAGTETLAYKSDESNIWYRLSGMKWFTSATDATISLALAKCVEKNGKTLYDDIKSIRPTLFVIPIKQNSSNEGDISNGISIIRLKDKAGTKQLPTAELLMKDTKGHIISDIGKGTKEISGMLHITRFHNSIAAVSYMRRIVFLGADFAYKRKAFGSFLSEKPLHVRTLCELELDTQGNMIFVLEVGLFLGRIENGLANDEENLIFRLLTSVLKLFTGKEVTRISSEGIELFGGVGMMENSFIPQILRDAQVLPIWEGTTNLLSIDFVKALRKINTKSQNVLTRDLNKRILGDEDLESEVKKFELYVLDLMKCPQDVVEANSRELAFSYARLFITCVCFQISRKVGDKMKQTLAHWRCRLKRENMCFINKVVYTMQYFDSANFGRSKDERGKLRSFY